MVKTLYTVASALYNIKLLYNGTVSMVTDAIYKYIYICIYLSDERYISEVEMKTI